MASLALVAVAVPVAVLGVSEFGVAEPESGKQGEAAQGVTVGDAVQQRQRRVDLVAQQLRVIRPVAPAAAAARVPGDW